MGLRTLIPAVLHFVGCPPGEMELDLVQVCPSYLSPYGSFFMLLVVEDLFR